MGLCLEQVNIPVGGCAQSATCPAPLLHMVGNHTYLDSIGVACHTLHVHMMPHYNLGCWSLLLDAVRFAASMFTRAPKPPHLEVLQVFTH